jgi:hypothetical protein
MPHTYNLHSSLSVHSCLVESSLCVFSDIGLRIGPEILRFRDGSRDAPPTRARGGARRARRATRASSESASRVCVCARQDVTQLTREPRDKIKED